MEGLRRADTGAVTPAPGKGHRGETRQKSDAERDLIGKMLVRFLACKIYPSFTASSLSRVTGELEP